MRASLIPFLIFFTAVMGGFHYYVWRRWVRVVTPDHRVRRALTLAFFALVGIFVWGGMGGRFLGFAPLPIRWIANIWIGVLGLAVFTLVCLDLPRLLWRWRAAPVSPARRLFLARLVAGTSAAVAGSLAGAALVEGLRRVRVKRVTITLAKLPPSADGYRIVQISDVHVGPTLRGEFVREVADQIRALAPDLLAITGDLVDGNVADVGPLLLPLADLHPPDGVFFVTGNHEYYSGAEAWLRHLPSLGIRPLQNERVRLPGFELAGVPDRTAADFRHQRAADFSRAVAGRDAALPLVLLAHQPRQAAEAIQHGVDLQLSGHTHGGQLFPMTLLVWLAQPFTTGLHRRGDFQIYVSAGTGYWGPPMRLGTEAEITEITLRRA